MVSRSRMPPPSCTGSSSPTSSTMARIAASFFGLPANAPFRSTRCRRRAPRSTQWRAMAAGSSENTVASSISPCLRRTQWPSLRSMAGISSIWQFLRSKVVWWRPRSGLPADEVCEQLQACAGTLLGMELDGKNIIPPHCTGKPRAVGGFGGPQGIVRRHDVVTMHEIEALAVVDTGPQRVSRVELRHFVPAHVRHLQMPAIGGLHAGRVGKAHDPARQDAQARHIALLAALEEHLLADADTQEGLAGGSRHDCITHATRFQLAHAVRHRALAGKHYPIGSRDLARIRRDDNPAAGRNVLDGLFDRAKVAHAVIDDGNAAHRNVTRS